MTLEEVTFKRNLMRRTKSTEYITAIYVVFLYQQKNKVSNIITFGNIQKPYIVCWAFLF